MSVLVAARNRPSALTVEPMNLPYLVTRRVPIGLIDLVAETWIPLAYSVPTWWWPNGTVVAYAAPAPATTSTGGAGDDDACGAGAVQQSGGDR